MADRPVLPSEVTANRGAGGAAGVMGDKRKRTMIAIAAGGLLALLFLATRRGRPADQPQPQLQQPQPDPNLQQGIPDTGAYAATQSDLATALFGLNQQLIQALLQSVNKTKQTKGGKGGGGHHGHHGGKGKSAPSAPLRADVNPDVAAPTARVAVSPAPAGIASPGHRKPGTHRRHH